MGLLDQIMGGGAAPRDKPGFGSTVAAGVVLALLVKAVREHQGAAASGERTRSFDPKSQEAAPQGGDSGGLLGGLGGLLGGGGLGQILSGLGGAGALQALISRFQENGFGRQAASWVSQGSNEPIAPDQVSDALGDHAVEELQQKTGLPRQSLLAEIAEALPEAIHQATPHGRAPSEEELRQVAHTPTRPGQ